MAKATGRGGWGGGGDGVGGGYGGGEGGGGRISILETRIGSSGDADFIAGASSLPLSLTRGHLNIETTSNAESLSTHAASPPQSDSFLFCFLRERSAVFFVFFLFLLFWKSSVKHPWINTIGMKALMLNRQDKYLTEEVERMGGGGQRRGEEAKL